ncbi:nucleoside/nucleotide kinase family protein [Chloroflexus aggregans]|uniref:phosphoribulokinase n=2 Tax=Chloroflexus aggregans TaxID=152260 RepID=B8G4G6_CHLAD|nr:uridine kinase [Chloroflexus aggregans]ACL23572.1 phosphoribulokinase/uridine kinase [Chloroflexus aggregans DSM 9485]
MDDQPLMLGLIGASGAGKTTLTRGIIRLLGAQGVTPISLDDYLRYSRAERAALGLTDADPAATDLERMAADLAALRRCQTINKPVYDHVAGAPRGSERVAPTGLVIAYGALTLTPPVQAELFDLTVYLDPHPDLYRRWREERDVKQRGYTLAEVQAAWPARERDIQRYITPQRPLADVVLRFGPGTDGLDVQMSLRRRALAFDLASVVQPAESAVAIQIRPVPADEDGLPAVLVSATNDPALQRVSDALRARLPVRGQVAAGEEPSPVSATLTFAQTLVAVMLLRQTVGLE